MITTKVNLTSIPNLMLPGLKSLLKNRIEAKVREEAEPIIKEVSQDIYNKLKVVLSGIQEFDSDKYIVTLRINDIDS